MITLRRFIHSLMSTDAELTQLVDAADFYDGQGIDADTVPPRPFVVVRWGLLSPGMNHVYRQQITLWAHDKSADYSHHILPILRRVRALFGAVVAAPTANGHINSIAWDGDSEDLFDEGFGTITRNSAYTIVGTGG